VGLLAAVMNIQGCNNRMVLDDDYDEGNDNNDDDLGLNHSDRKVRFHTSWLIRM
jgi:hypothetical protein